MEDNSGGPTLEALGLPLKRFQHFSKNCQRAVPLASLGCFGFFCFDKESQLIDSLHKLAQAGQILISDAADGVALYSILRPMKLIVGTSSAADAKRVFGKPVDSLADGDRERLSSIWV